MSTWSVLLSGQVIPLDSSKAKGKSLLIGRDTKCHIFIDSTGVSWHHAEIRKQKVENSNTYEYYLRDLGSSNGTFVKKIQVDSQGISSIDWEEVNPGSQYKLSSGDIVKFGDTDLTFTFEEKLVQTGEVYLSELIREQNKEAEDEEDDSEYEFIREERFDGKNQFLSQIADVISKNNPFKKQDQDDKSH